MKKYFSFGLSVLAVGALFTSCANYNETDNFSADPDPSYTEPYKDLDPVKTYIDKDNYPNMSIGATLTVSDFNKQELAHAAAVTNFDDLAFGTSLMSGSIINSKGVMNFLEMKNLLDHTEEIGAKVFGSPIVANANQAFDWLSTLTSPIEIQVEYVEGKTVDYSTMTTFTGTKESGSVSIASYDGQNCLKIGTAAKVRIIEDFEVDSLATYTTTFYVKSDKAASFNLTFSGNKVTSSSADGKFSVSAGKWTKVSIESKAAAGVKEGYLRLENTRSAIIYISKVNVGHTPDNHRSQTDQEKRDTIDYALSTWCNNMMDINAGRIQSFDLIDEAIDTKSTLDNGYYDLKHSTDRIYWQDIYGSENYAPVVSNVASKAYEDHGGDASQLKFFISESGLDNTKKMESLNYWIGVWDANGAKIDGINAKVSLTYSENADKQAANEASFNTLLDNLVATGKLIRLSNFDIRYQDASGANVTAKDITDEQRQTLADYYAYIIKCYMNKVPKDKQAGLCKGNISDTTDPVGLWSINSKGKDWVRTATYKAFCDALSGK